ncbi:DMT family transporter [Paracoccus sp. (in: a-proteobacteria)]|uniref:DMT family transporter n=1 Tax=Paracoccus sp. TaxID=267 RepID=UPI003A8994DB
MTDNARAAGLMTLSMALFALEDAFLKHLSMRLPVWQLLVMSGGTGCLAIWAAMARRGQRMWSRKLLHPVVLARGLGEAIGAVAYLTALAVGDLATASAVLQLLPLTLVMGAALFLGEQVGWRRWASVGLGLAGVLLIIRPGMAGFQPAALWALIGVAALTLRDLATRRIPADIPSGMVSGSAYAAVVPAGLLLALFSAPPVLPALPEWGSFAGALVLGVTGYIAMVAAGRIGEASAVAPFRYTRLGFALLVAVLAFGERPDAPTLIGAALIAAAGGYAMWREAQ